MAQVACLDKPPQLGLASQYTMGIRPQNAWVQCPGGRVQVCKHILAKKPYEMCFRITSLPPINTLVVKVTTPGYELNLSLFSQRISIAFDRHLQISELTHELCKLRDCLNLKFLFSHTLYAGNHVNRMHTKPTTWGQFAWEHSSYVVSHLVGGSTQKSGMQ